MPELTSLNLSHRPSLTNRGGHKHWTEGLKSHRIRWHPGWDLACCMPVLPHWKGTATAEQQIPRISADTCVSVTTWFVSATPHGLFAGLLQYSLKWFILHQWLLSAVETCNNVQLTLLSKACFILVKNAQRCSKFGKIIAKMSSQWNLNMFTG